MVKTCDSDRAGVYSSLSNLQYEDIFTVCVFVDGAGEDEMEVQDGASALMDRRKDQGSSQVDWNLTVILLLYYIKCGSVCQLQLSKYNNGLLARSLHWLYL